MKTIVETSTGVSKYVFEDSVSITMRKTKINTPNFIISDLNSTNATMHKGVTPPDDWVGNKYTFDGTSWAINPNWDEPVEEGSE